MDVDTVVNDEDDGPKPMKNMKEAEKQDNAADQFSNAHQEVYVAREKPSRDLVQAVQNHNMTHPRLEDELNKRHSVMRVVAVTTCNASTSTRKLSDYEKWHKRLFAENTYPRRRQRNVRKRDSTNIRKRKTNFVNRNKRLQSRRYDCKKRISLLSVCSQCLYVTVLDKKIGTEFDKLRSDNNASTSKSQNNSKETRDDAISIGTSGYPASSFQSFSSYHTIASQDHVPKV